MPDPVVRAADQLELVDMAPEALRRRLAHGNVFAERIDAASMSSSPPGMLRRSAPWRCWVADRVDEELNDYRERTTSPGHGRPRSGSWYWLTGSPGSSVLIRRATSMAMRTKAELVGVHVRTDDSLNGPGRRGGPGRPPAPATLGR